MEASPAGVRAKVDKLEHLRGLSAHTRHLSALPAERRRFLATVGRRRTGQALAGREPEHRCPILFTLPARSAAEGSTRSCSCSTRYDSSIDTFTVWNNGPDYRPDDGTKARLKVTKKDTTLTFTVTHEWRSEVNGQSRNFVLPNTFESGDEILIQNHSLTSSGGTLECGPGRHGCRARPRDEG